MKPVEDQEDKMKPSQGGNSIALKLFGDVLGDFLGHFLTLFDPGRLAFEAIHAGILFNLTNGPFFGPISEQFFNTVELPPRPWRAASRS